MQKFVDRAGRIWIVDIDNTTLRRVKTLTGVHLLEAIDGDLITRLSTDPLAAQEKGSEAWFGSVCQRFNGSILRWPLAGWHRAVGNSSWSDVAISSKETWTRSCHIVCSTGGNLSGRNRIDHLFLSGNLDSPWYAALINR